MPAFESAEEAIRWINGARWKGEKNGLANTRALLDALGNPEKRMGRVIHVAGTNGKGSTCAMIERALRECGLKTGLFTSPYLCRFQERIRLNGAPIPDDALTDVCARVREKAEKLAENGICATTFELLTAIACLYYADSAVDFAVMEVGMGGRFDSTNVLFPAVSVIAAIGMDHMARLGNTIGEIAFEKAGIVKPRTPAVVMTQSEDAMRVFRSAAREMNAPLFETAPVSVLSETADGASFAVPLPANGLTRARIRLGGAHQIANAALALTALDRLGIDMTRAVSGLEKTRWPGRLEWIGNVLIDGAHNPQAARTLADYIHTYFQGRRVALVTGMMQDKQYEACASIFKTFASDVVTARVDWPRALPADALAAVYGHGACAAPSIRTALSTAKRLAGEDGIVVVAGSIYLAGDVRNLLLPDDPGAI